MAGCDIAKGAAISITVASPWASCARMARRVPSASASNTELDGTEAMAYIIHDLYRSASPGHYRADGRSGIGWPRGPPGLSPPDSGCGSGRVPVLGPSADRSHSRAGGRTGMRGGRATTITRTHPASPHFTPLHQPWVPFHAPPLRGA